MTLSKQLCSPEKMWSSLSLQHGTGSTNQQLSNIGAMLSPSRCALNFAFNQTKSTSTPGPSTLSHLNVLASTWQSTTNAGNGLEKQSQMILINQPSNPFLLWGLRSSLSRTAQVSSYNISSIYLANCF